MDPACNAFTVAEHRHTRFWAVRDAAGQLICVCVYKRGALEVARRLDAGISYCLRDASPCAEKAGFAESAQLGQPSGRDHRGVRGVHAFSDQFLLPQAGTLPRFVE